MVRAIPAKYLKFSRELRRNQTLWEEKIWKHLRAGRFYGLKFKRQFRIGKYIIDFYCSSKKLVIELDGGQHNISNKRNGDFKRYEILKKEGFKIFRFWNNEIDNNIEGVLEKIKKEAD